ncbi:MAG TPA: hypothetical protein VG318_17545 [Actinomycetota bacterium]|nr:hypothetical protein [Actinomycetota bacterium]
MTLDRRVLEPMPDVELLGKALDLGRPELAGLLNRYVPGRPRPRHSLVPRPAALVVGDHPASPLGAALEDEGWKVRTCAGPSGAVRCPLMRGEECALRAPVDAAIVYVDPGTHPSRGTALPLLRCAADSASPSVVALEGRLDAARYKGRTAVVGALRGPAAIIAAVRNVLEPEES